MERKRRRVYEDMVAIIWAEKPNFFLSDVPQTIPYRFLGLKHVFCCAATHVSVRGAGRHFGDCHAENPQELPQVRLTRILNMTSRFKKQEQHSDGPLQDYRENRV